jgi:hypothetical protein
MTAASSPTARRVAWFACGGIRPERRLFGPARASGTMRSTGIPVGESQAPGWGFSRF